MRHQPALLALFFLATPASAQPIPDHLALARVCVSEVGFHGRESCAAIHTALRAKARRRGIPWTRHIRHYSPGLFRRTSDQPSRPWLVHLHLDGRRPRGWDSRLSWPRFRALWFQLLEFTLELIRNPRNPCVHPDTGEELEPTDWGVGPAVRRYRSAYPRAQVVACPCEGRRCNVFLRPDS
jgi:hypothetical protein